MATHWYDFFRDMKLRFTCYKFYFLTSQTIVFIFYLFIYFIYLNWQS